jgi:hypothetical protein
MRFYRPGGSWGRDSLDDAIAGVDDAYEGDHDQPTPYVRAWQHAQRWGRAQYRGYTIERGGPWGWQFVHEDYDGAPMETGGPPADPRCGYERSLTAVMERIDEMEDERS